MSKSVPPTTPPQLSAQGKTRHDQRQQRLAQALRANLHRRKAQAAGYADVKVETMSVPPKKPRP